MVREVQNTPLQKAILSNDFDVFCKLIESGVDIHDRGEGGISAPLHYAAADGREEMCRILLQQGANMEEQDDRDLSPLMWAAEKGHAGVVKLLLDAGAIPDAKDYFSRKALHYGACSQDLDTVRLLVAAGLDANEPDDEGYRPLHLVSIARNGKAISPESVKFLRDCGADIDAPDAKGRSPLSLAVTDNNLLACQVLTALGASTSFVPPNADKTYLTPFQTAITMGRTELVKFFISEFGEDPAQRTVSGRTMVQLCGKNAEMKLLIRSLKTTFAVQAGVGDHPDSDTQNVKRSKSLAPL